MKTGTRLGGRGGGACALELGSELVVKTHSLDGKFGGLKTAVEPENKNVMLVVNNKLINLVKISQRETKGIHTSEGS